MRLLYINILSIITTFHLHTNDDIYLLTIPKSGTHCIEKYFHLFNYLNKEIHFKIKRSHFSESYLGKPKGHFFDKSVRKIILVRDLRDVFISTLNHIETFNTYLMGKVSFSKSWMNLSYEEKLLEIVDYTRKSKHIIWSYKGNINYKGRTISQQLHKIVQQAVVFINLPNVEVVRYENLSGGRGREIQLEEIRKINLFLGHSLLESEENFMLENIFGNQLIYSQYFREGHTGKWNSLMSKRLCDRISDLYGHDLLELGYNSN